MERSGMMRCRPGIVPSSESASSEFATIPDQRCTTPLRCALQRIRETLRLSADSRIRRGLASRNARCAMLSAQGQQENRRVGWGEPTGPARSGRPDNRLREAHNDASPPTAAGASSAIARGTAPAGARPFSRWSGRSSLISASRCSGGSVKRSAKAAASLMYCARMSASWARPCSAEVSSTSSGLIEG